MENLQDKKLGGDTGPGVHTDYAGCIALMG